MTERTMPEGSGDERSLLDGWLDYYRPTLLAKCDGLTGQQLITRSCEPSPMSLIGLVRHMTDRLIEAALEVIGGLQPRPLGGDQAQDDHLARRDEPQRLKTAGPLVVVLQEEPVHVQLGEQSRA
jgi:Protein of unknown function (DUF664)